jgi:hypothetical protein
MDTYVLERLTGWTPELSPPPDSPLYRWRLLAGDTPPCREAASGFAVASSSADRLTKPSPGEIQNVV